MIKSSQYGIVACVGKDAFTHRPRFLLVFFLGGGARRRVLLIRLECQGRLAKTWLPDWLKVNRWLTLFTDIEDTQPILDNWEHLEGV